MNNSEEIKNFNLIGIRLKETNNLKEKDFLFKKVYYKIKNKLWTKITNVFKSEEESEDHFQDIMTDLYCNLHKWRTNVNFLGWCATYVWRDCLEVLRYRQYKFEKSFLSLEEKIKIDNFLDYKDSDDFNYEHLIKVDKNLMIEDKIHKEENVSEYFNTIKSAINSLDKKCQLCIKRKYYRNNSCKEIDELLNFKRSRNYLVIGRKKLKKIFAEKNFKKNNCQYLKKGERIIVNKIVSKILTFKKV